MKTKRILVVDDSPLIRSVIREMISSEPDMEIVGFATDGIEALQLAKTLKPDVITMDVEMPNQNGIWAVQQIMNEAPTPILMVSSLTSVGATATIDALAAGAYDFVCKPNNGSISDFKRVRKELITKIFESKSVACKGEAPPVTQARSPMASSNKVVVIASSTGGPRSLAMLWQQLPVNLPVPIMIVQHMPPGFTGSLATRLNGIGSVPCREAKPGDALQPNMAYMAPGGKHMRVGPNGVLKFDEGPTIHGVRPAADHLFQSAVELYGKRVVGLVLTGMGKDGAAGAKSIIDAGGSVLGESQETCTVYGMPKAARELGGISGEFPIQDMGHALVGLLSRRLANAS